MLRYFLILALSSVAFIAISQSSLQLLSPNDFEKKLTTLPDKQIVDVRTSEEFRQGHISGAIVIDYYKDDFKAQLSKLDKNKPVFVYCAGGGRSGASASLLSDLGFKQIYDLRGGFNAWSKASKPTVK